MSFEKFCTNVFERMERNLLERNELLFWGAGKALPTLELVEKAPGNGTWYANAKVAPGCTAGISLMLVHGELRVGSIIPKTVIDRDSDDDLIALSPDGNPPDALRELDGSYLYDRSYQIETFSARFLLEAYNDPDKAEAVALTMGALVSSTWKAAYATLARHQQSGLPYPVVLLSEAPLPTERLKREMMLAIHDTTFFPGLGYLAQTRSAVPADELATQISDAGMEGVRVSMHEEVDAAVAA